jgi:hypothetical protein
MSQARKGAIGCAGQVSKIERFRNSWGVGAPRREAIYGALCGQPNGVPMTQVWPPMRLPSGPAGFLFFLPRTDASDRFQLGIPCPRASIFATFFLPARILRALVPGAADKSISSRSIMVTTSVFFGGKSGSSTSKRIAMLANPTREVRIDQFADFAHDFHPSPWEKPRSAIIRNLNAAARLTLKQELEA